MEPLRRLIRSRAVGTALSWLAARYIRLVWVTGRWRLDNFDIPAGMVADGKPFIACFWHGRMLMAPNSWLFDAHMDVVASQHRDGVFISRTVAWLGFGTISGSTSRGGAGALVGIVRALRRGVYIGITPDGPRGPRMHVAPGAAMAARMSGAPLVPFSYTAKWRIVASSWDRFVVPLPFTRGILRFGEPIPVAADADDAALEAARARLESTLNRMTHELDAELGVETVHPDTGGASALSPAGSAE